MKYEKTLNALKKSWSEESCSKYDKENPSMGQCSVTAIVIQRKFGGEILKTKVNGNWHFYNKIGKKIHDFTAEQFSEKVEYLNDNSSIEEALTDCTESQVDALWTKLNKALENE